MPKNQDKYIAVIGAANVDIIGRAHGPIIAEDSNPGQIHLCPGGVGRNIAENLARLSVDVKLVGALGNDAFGRMVIEQSEASGIDMSCCHVEKGGVTSSYMAILDDGGEMELALSDVRINEKKLIDTIGRHSKMIEDAELVVLDANLSQPVITFILDSFPRQRTIVDPVSVGKAKHIQSLIGRFDTVKMNRIEAEFLSGASISTVGDLCHAGDFFLQKGARRVFITLGSDGVYYQTAGVQEIYKTPHIEPANATGAGDAFTAGVAYCAMHGHDIIYTARFSCAMARIALRSPSTVSPEMSVGRVLEEMENL